jgi:hypothetical protein
MTRAMVCARAVVSALVLGMATLWAVENAHAQLAKRGTYSGKFAFFDDNATVVPIRDKQLIYHAVGQGPFINDAGSGFLHMTVVTCPGRGFIDDGAVEFSGYCSATDKDGDKAVLRWSCTARNAPCAGAFEWIAGTGKYLGIKGRASFEAHGLGQAATGPVGYAVWKGEYELQ